MADIDEISCAIIHVGHSDNDYELLHGSQQFMPNPFSDVSRLTSKIYFPTTVFV